MMSEKMLFRSLSVLAAFIVLITGLYMLRFGMSIFGVLTMIVLWYASGMGWGYGSASGWKTDRDINVRMTQIDAHTENGIDVPFNIAECLTGELRRLQNGDGRCNAQFTLSDGTHTSCFEKQGHKGRHSGWLATHDVCRWDDGCTSEDENCKTVKVGAWDAGHFIWKHHA